MAFFDSIPERVLSFGKKQIANDVSLLLYFTDQNYFLFGQ